MIKIFNSTRTALKIIGGLVRICGFKIAYLYIVCFIKHLSNYLKTKDLGIVGRALGEGPFICKSPNGRAWVGGKGVINAIIEVWVINDYLAGGFLSIPEEKSIVLDLGCSLGDFTLLALSYSPNVYVISVDPSIYACNNLKSLLDLNGWSNRADIINGFIGGKTSKQENLMTMADTSSNYISQEDLILKYNLTKVDFIKCDIEGSEFILFNEDSKLLKITKQLAIELHDWGGDFDKFKFMLIYSGFTVVTHRTGSDNCILHAKRM